MKHILQQLWEELGSVKLVAVSKTHSTDAIMEAYRAGQRAFGESRVNELVEKYNTLPKDIEWHLIGHLQTNKVRQIISFVTLIQSVDSERILLEIEHQAAKIGRMVDVLLEIHIAKETTKTGWNKLEVIDYIASNKWQSLKHIRICGIMGIATNTDDRDTIRDEFSQLKELSDRLKFPLLSMGMTSDYRIAIECGTTMVRIGSLIFGHRRYNTSLPTL